MGIAIPCSAQNREEAKKRAAPFSPQASALTGKQTDQLRIDMDAVVKGFDFLPFYRGAKLKGATTTGNWQLQDDGDELILRPRDGEEGWRRFSAYLWSDRAYSDFVIDFEFQFEARGNTGFYFRVADREDPVETGCEFQLNDTTAKGDEINHHDIGGLLRGPSRRRECGQEGRRVEPGDCPYRGKPNACLPQWISNTRHRPLQDATFGPPGKRVHWFSRSWSKSLAPERSFRGTHSR